MKHIFVFISFHFLLLILIRIVATSTSSSWGGTPRRSQTSSEISSLQRVLGEPQGLLLDGHPPKHVPRETSRRHHHQIPNHLHWLLSIQRSSGSTPSLFLDVQAAHPLSKAEPCEKSLCRIPNLILSVTTQSS